MAIELIENADAKLLEVKVSGKLTADDYSTLEPGVEKLINDAEKIKILFIMSDFHGWDVGAVWEDIKFATKHCRDIEKVAMVGENSWEKWMAAICKPFTMSSIKYFDAGDVDAAREWITS
ncbi:MAG: STAS/SEC14 domain-containing protein [Planctomycetota bacterium]